MPAKIIIQIEILKIFMHLPEDNELMILLISKS